MVIILYQLPVIMKKLLLITSICILTVFTNLLYGQTPLKMRDTTVKGPQTFAMVVGVSNYKYIRPLRYADKDAELFRDFLKSPGGGSLKEENIFCLLNNNALNSTFWSKGFQWLKAKKLQKGDRLFIYLAGHGDAIDEDQFFFLTYDCNPGGDKNNYLAGGAIQLFNLKKKIANETTKGVEVFFIMDACRSNELPGGQDGLNFLNTAISEKKAGEIIMLATAAGEESLEDASIGTGHGLFTYYLVDGLSGVADINGMPDNKVTFQEIQSYVDEKVPSIAQERFRRKQDPYFCCNENSEKVITTVDTAYLSNWLRMKKQQNPGGGNSFSGERKSRFYLPAADTALVETYNRFYKAIKNKNLTGNSSAEEYYQQLSKKFPGDPYTLDAQSTLAVEYINAAQAKINLYLSCSDEPSAKEKQHNYELGVNLEKAINLLKEDEPDFANSLSGRMYLLKASGDWGTNGKNGDISSAFQFLYAAKAAEPGAAYIQNKLALLHLQNNRKDSALFYANNAVKTAPKWVCAFNTLALVQNALNNNNPVDSSKKKNVNHKVQFGGIVGSGISKPAATTIRRSGSDTLSLTGIDGRLKYDLGVTAQISIGDMIDIRPSVQISIENSRFNYRRINTANIETVPVKTTSIAVPIPLVFRLSQKNIAPFISAGPTFSLLMQKKDNNSARLSVKPIDVMGDIGVGLDIGLLKSHLIMSPEIKYSRGLTDVKENQENGYSTFITKLNRQNFTFSIYLRRK